MPHIVESATHNVAIGLELPPLFEELISAQVSTSRKVLEVPDKTKGKGN
jgi:hypothetical protein